MAFFDELESAGAQMAGGGAGDLVLGQAVGSGVGDGLEGLYEPWGNVPLGGGWVRRIGGADSGSPEFCEPDLDLRCGLAVGGGDADVAEKDQLPAREGRERCAGAGVL
ncbi:hypothetical protein AB0J38_11390 [Streptomyces sp. NPDC050095]|uniref:hypothetical protein n=1 Tax=unclassified Streptomyces TaxID=2593676 RepID=UPI0034140209